MRYKPYKDFNIFMLMKRYCEFRDCECRDRKLPPFKHADRKVRFLHKKCFKKYNEEVRSINSVPEEFKTLRDRIPLEIDRLIVPNQLNIPIEKCLVCGIQNRDTKTGYCLTHNKMNNWVLFG